MGNEKQRSLGVTSSGGKIPKIEELYQGAKATFEMVDGSWHEKKMGFVVRPELIKR